MKDNITLNGRLSKNEEYFYKLINKELNRRKTNYSLNDSIDIDVYYIFRNYGIALPEAKEIIAKWKEKEIIGQKDYSKFKFFEIIDGEEYRIVPNQTNKELSDVVSE